jgi:hypothetical protein
MVQLYFNLDIAEEEGCLIIKKDIKKRRKQFESLYMKTLPTVFFILFLMIFCMILIRFVPNFYSAAGSKHFFLAKDKIKYLPEYFADENNFAKVYKSLITSDLNDMFSDSFYNYDSDTHFFDPSAHFSSRADRGEEQKLFCAIFSNDFGGVHDFDHFI